MHSPPRLKLSHMLAGLVIVPLLFELAFVLVLATLLRQAEHEAIKETHAKIVITKCNKMHDSIFDAGNALIEYKLTRDDALGRKYFDLVANVLDDLRTIEILVHDNASQEKALSDLQRSCGAGLELLESFRKTINQPEQTITPVTDIKGARQTTQDRILGSIQQLVGEERRIRDVAPMKRSALRGQIFYAFTAGIVFNIALAFVLIILVYKGLVTRIDIMVRNTQSIVARDKLLPRVTGSDEISHLDAVFHDMADEIDRIERHKRELLTIVGHNLRSPLMSVQKSLDLIDSGALGEPPAGMTKEVGVTSLTVKRLIALTNDALDIEKIEAGGLEMHISGQSLLAIIDSAIDAVDRAADRRGIFIQRPFPEVELDCDHQRLVQVLVNLLSNAISVSPDDSEIHLEVDDSATELIVRVRDNGPGLEQKVLENIFEPFHYGISLPNVQESEFSVKGTGLGLAISKAIISGHGGRIEVDSVVGQGSTFWFSVPKRTVT
ncbi:MAG: HAMP domain-containing histidine kinase [Candidatus Obscuribacterales bacterium]|nr:HAMP domain-containing histidine kinase [Candidatus Obscuribacterales bacterium]